MIIRCRRSKVYVVQAIVYLAALFFSFNPFTAQAASGSNDTVAIQHDGWKPTHNEEMTPCRSLHDSLLKWIEQEKGYPPSRDEYLRYLRERLDKRPGLENPHCLPSEEKVFGNGVEGAHTSGTTWATEYLDEPRFFFHLSSRAIAVDANNHPHIAYGGDHLYYSYHDGESWHYETVDSSFDVGDAAAIALDASGHVHISYTDNYNRDLKYATNKSGSWATTTIDSYTWVGYTSSIAIDAAGYVHISYLDQAEFLGNDNLKYATNASGAWVITTVDSEYIGFNNSIAVDASGHAHISYKGLSNGLMYATNASGTWVTITLDSDLSSGIWNSIAVDASGHPHIGYLNGGIIPNLKYATNTSGSWVTTTVDSDEGTGLFTSLALDASGHAHISYFDEANTLLKYATNASGSWVTATINNREPILTTAITTDTMGRAHVCYFGRGSSSGALEYATNVSGAWVTTAVDILKGSGWFVSLALDASGHSHISHMGYSNPNRELLYTTNVSGEWVTSIVDNDFAGFGSSIALDALGHVHISYRSYPGRTDTGILKYATNASGEWVMAAVDSDSAISGHTSLALDASGYAHISYYDYGNTSLKYATNASGAWVTTTLDNTGDMGRYNSLALDKDGKAHISYLHYIGGWEAALRYATNASGAWVAITVDNNGDVGFDTSLKLDSKGNVHISYNDEWNSDLKYATNKSGRWVAETIASEGETGWHTSLALDADDKAHISHLQLTYYGFYNDLKYTTNASGRWVTTTVDNKGNQGYYSSIRVDASGRAHIAYSDMTLHDLKYAVSIPPPTVITSPATRVTETSARLNATVNANHLPTEVWFEWGMARGGPYNRVSPKKTFDGGTNEKYRYKARNLTKEITYYYRVVAENEDGITYGDEESFETKRKESH